MSFTLLTLAIFAVSAVFIYRHVRLGYKRGLSKTLITLAILLFSALISAAASPWIVSPVVDLGANWVTSEAGVEMINEKGLQELYGFVQGYIPAIAIMLKSLLAIIVYLPVFFIVRLLTALVIKLIYQIIVRKEGIRKPKYKNEDEDDYVKRDRSIAAAVGAISGVMLSIIFFMPFTCGLKTVNNAVDVAQGLMGEEMFPDVPELKLLDKYSNDASGTVINSLGGKALFDMTTRISYGGEVSCIDDELEAVASVDVNSLMAAVSDPEGATIGKIVVVEPLLKNVSDTVAVKMIVVSVIKEASLTWLDYKDYMGIPRPDFGGQKSMDRFLDSMLIVCSDTTFESYDANITTLLNVARIVSDNEALFEIVDYNEFITSFADSNALTRIEAELDANPNMSRVRLAINDMLMSTVVNELHLADRFDDATKNALYKALADALNDVKDLSGPDKTAELTLKLTESFESRGITIPPEIGERIAEAMESGVPSKDGKITAREIETYLNMFKD